MSEVQTAMVRLQDALADIRFPAGFLNDYDQLECLACGHGTETYLVASRCSRQLFIAKCYDRNIHKAVHESSILKTLQHDGLPVLADEYMDDDLICIVRQYIPGTPLHQHMRDHKLSDAGTVALGVELCDLLTYLHSQKPPVIHRDIKPQNVIVREDGAVALIDFEISRTYDSDADTDTQFIGTRRFAPPEQYGFSQTDARADIYSVGVLLCWMLTGDTDVKTARIADERLDAIVRRCAAFSPEDRFPSADAVKKALLGVDRTRRRKVLQSGLIAALALLSLCAGFGVGRYTQLFTFASQPQGVRFQEPIIEKAVRLQLHKSALEPLRAVDLATVKAIYIFGNEVSLTQDAFADGLSGERAKTQRGSIQTLEDIKLLPSLETMMVAYQNLADIAPVAQAKYLVSISLIHTRVSDISPLAHMIALTDVNLYDTNVSDVTILDTCLRMNSLNIGATLVRSIERVGGMDSLERLSLDRLSFNTLEGLEHFTRLTSLSLKQTHIGDLSALRAMPALRSVTLSEDMRARASLLLDHTGISLTAE